MTEKHVTKSEAAPHDPVEAGTNRRHSWDDFRESGMLWLANRTLHLFGWAIVVSYDDETGAFVEAYPVRTEWRGFGPEAETRGYTRVAEWMRKASPALAEETER